MLPPGPDYPALGRLLIPASLVMLIVVISAGRWLGRRPDPVMATRAVIRLQQE